MTYPIHITYDSDGDVASQTLMSNCTACTISETDTDFTASVQFVASSISGCGSDPALRDTLRIKHSDGCYYDFKVSAISYSNGSYSVSAKYKAYETAGVVNEPIVGMYSPKQMVGIMNASLHGIEIETSVSSDIDDRVFGIAVTSPQAYRTTLYNQVIGATNGCHLIPYNTTDLKLVASRGRSTAIHLSTGREITSLSIDKQVTSKPNDIIALYKDEETYKMMYGSSTPVSSSVSGEGEFYDASSDLQDFTSTVTQSVITEYANKRMDKSNPNRISDETTIKLDLSPEAPALFIGDYIKVHDDVLGDVSETYNAKTVTQVEYDSLNECMTSVTIGDLSQSVADIIASQDSGIKEDEFLSNGSETIQPSDFDENLEYSFYILGYDFGQVLTYSCTPRYGYSGDEQIDYDPRLSAVDNYTFTVKVSHLPTEALEFKWWIHSITKQTLMIYDNGDLCDITWQNANSAFVFDTDKITLDGTGTKSAICTEAIEYKGYCRIIFEYKITGSKTIYYGYCDTPDISLAVPTRSYGTMLSSKTASEYLLMTGPNLPDTLSIKIYGLSGAKMEIYRIYLST